MLLSARNHPTAPAQEISALDSSLTEIKSHPFLTSFSLSLSVNQDRRYFNIPLSNPSWHVSGEQESHTLWAMPAAIGAPHTRCTAPRYWHGDGLV